MDRETAVASIVAAESPPGAPMEARKAQAVVARSFLIASRGRHDGFDFCDTTHCQFLREPASPASMARRAQEATANLALTYEGRPIAALYSANCGGRTRTLAEAGWQTEAYPYFAVDCPARGEIAGHRIGMCQTGAAELARRGATFREILSRYFPATSIEEIR
jgi:stage II sporulation protein D